MASERRTLRVEISPRILFTALALVAGVYLLIQLRVVVLMIVVALVLVGTIEPLVAALERRRIPRGLALVIVFFAMTGTLLLIGVVTVPPLVAQLASLIERAPSLQQQIASRLEHTQLLAPLAGAVRGARSPELLRQSAAWLVQLSQRIALLFGQTATVVFLALYLIADRERSRAALFAVFPRRYHQRLATVLPRLEAIVGGYMRGQLVTSALITLYVFLLLTILGVPGALALAVSAGVADVLPFVGGLLATAPAVLVALTRGPATALIVLAAMLVYLIIESRVLVPRVYGRALRLPPAAVIVAILVGGTLLGIPGAFLALPIAAAIRTVLRP